MLINIKRKVRKTPSGRYMVVKKHYFCGIPVSRWADDWPAELADYKAAIRALMHKERYF